MTVSQTAPHGAPINQLIPLDFEEHPVRIVLDERGAPWFHAGDVCRVLGYVNSRKALGDHVDPEDVTKRDTLTAGGLQQANFINESGLYALIFGSTKPEAKRFKRWVTSDVLPTIRQSGGYGIGRDMQEALVEAAEQIGQLVADLRKPSASTPNLSRAELKARYNRSGAMDFHQAIQPVHLEYGHAWTTSMAICQACNLNHHVLVEKIGQLVRDGKLPAAEHSPLLMTSMGQWEGIIHGYQLSESGCKKVIALLETMDINATVRTAILTGANTLAEAFAGLQHKPLRGRPPREQDSFASAMAKLGTILSRMASTISAQGGSTHG